MNKTFLDPGDALSPSHALKSAHRPSSMLPCVNTKALAVPLLTTRCNAPHRYVVVSLAAIPFAGSPNSFALQQ